MSIALQNAIERILAPLARLLISKGVTYGVASKLLKSALVREAEARLSDATVKATDSRLSIATGIHRKDIKRLREPDRDYLAPQEGSISAQVIAKWLGDPKFTDKKMRPRLLPKKKSNSKEIDFDDLVTSISTDIRPRAVLDDLIDRQVVTVRGDELLELDPERLTLNQDEQALTTYMGMNIHDHFAVAVNNLLNPNDPQLERCVHYHGLSEEAAAKLAHFAEKKAMQALLSVNEEALRLIKSEKNQGAQRINFGMYFHRALKEVTSATEKNQ